jgi:hypothetical protein
MVLLHGFLDQFSFLFLGTFCQGSNDVERNKLAGNTGGQSCEKECHWFLRLIEYEDESSSSVLLEVLAPFALFLLLLRSHLSIALTFLSSFIAA